MNVEDVEVEMEVELDSSMSQSSHSQTQVGANCAAQSQVCLQTVLNRRGRRGDEGMGMQARSIKAQRVHSFWSLFCIALLTEGRCLFDIPEVVHTDEYVRMHIHDFVREFYMSI